MHKSDSVIENQTYKFRWDFDIQIVHLISEMKPGLVIIKREINLA